MSEGGRLAERAKQRAKKPAVDNRTALILNALADEFLAAEERAEEAEAEALDANKKVVALGTALLEARAALAFAEPGE